MLFVIDIGNTEIVTGLFEKEILVGQWRISTHLHKTADEYGLQVLQLLETQNYTATQVDGVILSSVVPPLSTVFQDMIDCYFSLTPIIVSEKIETGLTICYENPREVGADRLVNAAAAYHLYGGPLIIVDLGTATTFCAISKEGDYLGGAIAPGMALSAEALVNRTAKLPRVALRKPAYVIGKDTVSSMQSGIFFGYIGLINEIIYRIHQETGVESEVLATGGLAGLIAPECSSISKIHPTLTLQGLMIIYRMNT